MGDRTFASGKKVRKAKTLSVGERCGSLVGRRLALPGARIVIVVYHHWTKVAVASWAMSAWEYASLDAESEESVMSKFLKNVNAAPKVDKDSPTAATDKDFAKTHPALVEFMTLRRNDDGTPRQTSSLLIFCEDGVWKACLSERERELTLWAAGDTLAELLEAMEATLQSPAPQWRTKSGKRTKGK